MCGPQKFPLASAVTRSGIPSESDDGLRAIGVMREHSPLDLELPCSFLTKSFLPPPLPAVPQFFFLGFLSPLSRRLGLGRNRVILRPLRTRFNQVESFNP